ncbi:methyltransferase domain-containing protein [Actinocrinis puniceicyclus]|uniref:Methyltransferase domain-containing protein n=1 Tax=Actinocrinis puniceicyclus TaxID=977794 RepID=A0A8J7WTR5_9ACTN|nr:methyltransferase domain-containing protein [Actinocrinis puniceicyclus]MBS2965029.1 methyltransferase domain-containing protein [Actinocrinis puniceicyclus]
MTSPEINSNLQSVSRYYDHTESRVGYKYLFGGTKHFGWYAPGDRAWHFRSALRRMEDELVRRLQVSEDEQVLDAGCGVGDVARTVAAKCRVSVVGIDVLEYNLDEARRRSSAAGLDQVTSFQLGDYHVLDFQDSTFDAVYTMETLVHAADPAKALSEFRRVLRPGGRLIMFEYSHAPVEAMTPDARRALERVCDLGAMPTWLMLDDGRMQQLLEAEGFTDVRAEDVTDRMLPMLRVFSVLGRFPYLMGRVLGKVPKVVNAMSGVEWYRHRSVWRYNIYTATNSD